MNDYCCIPPKENAEFVASMEDILDIYEMPYNPKIPVVCMDEKLYQCLSEIREPLPMRLGDNQKWTLNMSEKESVVFFIFTEHLRGWRYNNVRKTRTTLDWAEKKVSVGRVLPYSSKDYSDYG